MNLVMRGTLWVDPATGVIMRTSMWVADAAVLATITVNFREDEAMALWVPAEMTEHYRASTGWRRFAARRAIATIASSAFRRTN